MSIAKEIKNANGNETMTAIRDALNKITDMTEVEKEAGIVEELRDNIKLQAHVEDDVISYIEEATKNISVEEIQKMNSETFDAKFSFNGEKIRFGKERDFAFTRDLVAYFKMTEESLKEIDEAKKGLDETFKESQDEMTKLLEEFGSMSAIVRSKMVDDLDKASNEETKLKIKEMLEYYDDAPSLSKFIKWAENEDNEMIFKMYTDQDSVSAITRRFFENTPQLKLPIDGKNIHKCQHFERIVLGEKYEKMNNLFLFLWMRYSSNIINNNKRLQPMQRLYAVRIALLLKQTLGFEPLCSEEEETTFIKSVKELLDAKDPSLYASL